MPKEVKLSLEFKNMVKIEFLSKKTILHNGFIKIEKNLATFLQPL